MGSFSWKLAEGSNTYGQDSMYEGRPVKLLVPQEFGGGYVAGRYCDYGDFFTVNRHQKERVVPELAPGEKWAGSFDVYEWLAVWSNPELATNGNMLPLVSEKTNELRTLGIKLFYSGQLEYPPVFVDFRENLTYEEAGESLSCPENGYVKTVATQRAWRQFLKNNEQSTNPYFKMLDMKTGDALPVELDYDGATYQAEQQEK